MITPSEYEFNSSDTNADTTNAILNRLKDGPATTSDLIPFSHRFSINIAELRKLGYEIRSRRITGSKQCEFELVGKRDVAIVTEAMKEAYYETEHWRRTRLERIRIDGGRCTQCKSDKDLQVHHWKYDLFNEDVEHDLTTLCRLCHEIMHDFDSVRIAFPASVSPEIAARMAPREVSNNGVQQEGRAASAGQAQAVASPGHSGQRTEHTAGSGKAQGQLRDGETHPLTSQLAALAEKRAAAEQQMNLF